MTENFEFDYIFRTLYTIYERFMAKVYSGDWNDKPNVDRNYTIYLDINKRVYASVIDKIGITNWDNWSFEKTDYNLIYPTVNLNASKFINLLYKNYNKFERLTIKFDKNISKFYSRTISESGSDVKNKNGKEENSTNQEDKNIINRVNSSTENHQEEQGSAQEKAPVNESLSITSIKTPDTKVVGKATATIKKDDTDNENSNLTKLIKTNKQADENEEISYGKEINEKIINPDYEMKYQKWIIEEFNNLQNILWDCVRPLIREFNQIF